VTAEQIVDAHHHLWELARFPYPWLLPSAPPRPFGDHGAIKRDYRIGDYLDDTAARVAASVHVQANAGATDPVAETRWVAQEAARSGRSIAIVGFADPLDPDLPRTLDRHMAVADFRGVRIFAGWDHSPGWTQICRSTSSFSRRRWATSLNWRWHSHGCGSP
jgi:predicted TIM-barrel fold metal-dependent hydrolase